MGPPALAVLCQYLAGDGALDKHPDAVEYDDEGDADGNHGQVERVEDIFGVVKVGHGTWGRISIRVGACFVEHGFSRTAETVTVLARVLSSCPLTGGKL